MCERIDAQTKEHKDELLEAVDEMRGNRQLSPNGFNVMEDGQELISDKELKMVVK